MNVKRLFGKLRLIQARTAPRPHHSRRRNQSGFTLIETLILIGLVTIGVSAVVYLMAISSSLSIETKDSQQAYQAANEFMEYLRQQPFSTLTNVTDQTWGTTAPTAGVSQTAVNVGYNALSKLLNPQGLYTISNYQGQATMKQITVRVNWSRKTTGARDRSISIVTIMTDKGLNERWK